MFFVTARFQKDRLRFEHHDTNRLCQKRLVYCCAQIVRSAHTRVQSRETINSRVIRKKRRCRRNEPLVLQLVCEHTPGMCASSAVHVYQRRLIYSVLCTLIRGVLFVRSGDLFGGGVYAPKRYLIFRRGGGITIIVTLMCNIKLSSFNIAVA